ncbi:hypothetical protein C8R44DRAFT_724284 [Mycena epipterygia]|nr:hypothetical protein C8R44DRAFT_724284 [Mycena epipterygia]
MQALPTELLRHIFKRTLSSREKAIKNGRISFLDNPWSLTLVSSSWREIALGMPSLWSSLVISIEPLTPSATNYPLPLLQLQIARSGTHPLRVLFVSKEISGDTTQRLFDALVASCDRWETLELDSASPLKESSLARLRGNLPLLREMYVSVTSPRDQLDRSIFDSAPQLGTAWLVNPTFDDDSQPEIQPADQIVPWTRLTSYVSTYKDLRQFERLRSAAPNLVECLVAVVIPDSWQAPARPTLFPHLRKLMLAAPPKFIDSLRLPALEELFIDQSDSELDDFAQLVGLVQRSGCSLRNCG